MARELVTTLVNLTFSKTRSSDSREAPSDIRGNLLDLGNPSNMLGRVPTEAVVYGFARPERIINLSI